MQILYKKPTPLVHFFTADYFTALFSFKIQCAIGFEEEKY